jgi:hypothetical protein
MSLFLQGKNLHLWLFSYFLWSLSRKKSVLTLRKKMKAPVKHLLFAICDHFEPRWEDPDTLVEFERVNKWHKLYPLLAKKFCDSDGCHPRHTFFYPSEEYDPAHLSKLSSLERQGLGEVEIHLHHDNDTPENLEKTLDEFKKILRNEHGLLSTCGKEVGYAFIHGNWAIDNSRPDGKKCGVNNELSILKKTGCFADFTMPSAPDITQTSTINSIYYVKGKDGCAKSHDKGRDLSIGSGSSNGELLMIQGPLTLNFKKRKFAIFPKIENSEISYCNPPTPDRVDLWVESGICVKGREDWVFVKTYTHGAQEKNIDLFFSGSIERMHAYLQSTYNDGAKWILHYVTAREMYNIAMAAADGKEGNPSLYRDCKYRKI